MALYKEIKQDDGVNTTYHRILYVQNMINSHCSIAVVSYVDNVARTNELENIISRPYQKAVTYETGYVEFMTPEKAYEYLKTLPEFVDAEDV